MEEAKQGALGKQQILQAFPFEAGNSYLVAAHPPLDREKKKYTMKQLLKRPAKARRSSATSGWMFGPSANTTMQKPLTFFLFFLPKLSPSLQLMVFRPRQYHRVVVSQSVSWVQSYSTLEG